MCPDEVDVGGLETWTGLAVLEHNDERDFAEIHEFVDLCVEIVRCRVHDRFVFLDFGKQRRFEPFTWRAHTTFSAMDQKNKRLFVLLKLFQFFKRLQFLNHFSKFSKFSK